MNFLSREAMEEVRDAVKAWLQSCPELPLPDITFEDLPANNTGIAFETAQSAVYLQKYILGGYRAQYQFRILYRIIPSDDNDALEANRALTAIANWCEESEEKPQLTDAVNIRIERTSDAAILAAYEDGTEDYGIDLTLTWEVI